MGRWLHHRIVCAVKDHNTQRCLSAHRCVPTPLLARSIAVYFLTAGRLLAPWRRQWRKACDDDCDFTVHYCHLLALLLVACLTSRAEARHW